MVRTKFSSGEDCAYNFDRYSYILCPEFSSAGCFPQASPQKLARKLNRFQRVSMPRRLINVLVSLLLSVQAVAGQTPQRPTPTDQGDVLRVYTELVQTDVMVFDKNGNFVNGLKASDFELRIDGKPKQIEFFEKITAGSVNEETLIAAARGSSRRPGTGGAAAPLGSRTTRFLLRRRPTPRYTKCEVYPETY